jgi:hypothetical protein
MTRQTSTGISLVALFILTAFDLAHFIIFCVFTWYDIPELKLVVGTLAIVSIMLKQLHIFLKPDFKLSQTKVPKLAQSVRIPDQLRFRSATTAEKESYARDSLFDWRIRITVSRSHLCQAADK